VDVEALVRWESPERGLVPPLEFVPLAEATGLVVPMGTWVLREACRQLATWDADPASGLAGLGVAVNVSPRQLEAAGLLDEVRATLTAHGIDPQRLTIEITESALGDSGSTLPVLQALKDLGVRLSLDDFGTGYSSLANLKRLPVDAIKIDKSFVIDMAVDASDAAIVRSTIDLAHNLGLRVVAEGVESEDAWRHLEALGCDFAQGYYLSRPLPVDAATRMIRERGTGRDRPPALRVLQGFAS
jgi:EAL domain-containing protein (putative c-di-GMP-specific phosphodiesterase class I)